MTKNETLYDEIGCILMEYATLVCAIAETPSTNAKIHKIKLDSVLNLRDATQSLIMKKFGEKVEKNLSVSSN